MYVLEGFYIDYEPVDGLDNVQPCLPDHLLPDLISNKHLLININTAIILLYKSCTYHSYISI